MSIPPVIGAVTSVVRREELHDILVDYLVDRVELTEDMLKQTPLEELLARALSMAGYMR